MAENVFQAEVGSNTITVLGCEFTVSDEIASSLQGKESVKVYIPCDKVELTDNEEDGIFTGNVAFILYKGNHYHLTVDTDWVEKLYVDTQDQWDLGDHVGIKIDVNDLIIKSSEL